MSMSKQIHVKTVDRKSKMAYALVLFDPETQHRPNRQSIISSLSK